MRNNIIKLPKNQFSIGIHHTRIEDDAEFNKTYEVIRSFDLKFKNDTGVICKTIKSIVEEVLLAYGIDTSINIVVHDPEGRKGEGETSFNASAEYELY